MGASEDAPAELRYPDFLCVGAQKAGTTWLDRNLRRHPGLWLPPMKELQYFSHLYLPLTRKWTTRQRHERGSQLLRRYIEKYDPEDWDLRHIARVADIAGGPVSDDWYGRIFNLAPPERICGEVTPDYATLPDEGIRHVLALSPQVRIILSMRDPIERSWSHIRMIAQSRDMVDIAQLAQIATNGDQYRRADYPTIIDTWRKFVPEDRFLTLFMDDIATEPRGVLTEVCGFLGVECHDRLFAKAANTVHAGTPQEIPPPILDILKSSLRPIYEKLATLYPEIGARWASRYY